MPELQDVVDAFDKIEGEIKSFQEKADAEIKANGKANEDTKSALDGLADRLLGLEQKMARRVGGGAIEVKSFGHQVVESDGFKSFRAGETNKAKIEVKATITSATTDAAGSVGDAIVPHRAPFVALQDRQLTIRDLISSSPTTSNSIQYPREKAFTNSAAPVAENPGTSKPVSDVQFEMKDAPVRTIAHLFHVSKQALDDVPQLIQHINNRGLYGLRYVEEQQVLNGSGMGLNLLGIFPQAAAFQESSLGGLVETYQMADAIRLAILQARQEEFRATGIVMSPQSLAAIELLKTTGEASSGEYLWSSPRQMATPSLWGLPVIETQSIGVDEFLVGDFKNAATIWDRQSPTVELSEHHDQNFSQNLVTIRVESRIALTVTRPDAMVKGDWGGSPSINV